MSSNDPHHSGDNKLKELTERLSKIKFPSGKDPVSFDSLQSRFELLKCPQSNVSLDDLTSRFAVLEGHNSVFINNSMSHTTDVKNEDEDEDDDFLDFIENTISAGYVLPGESTTMGSEFCERKVVHANRKCKEIMGEGSVGYDNNITAVSENMSDLEDLLYACEETNGFVSESMLKVSTTHSNSTSSVTVPERDKTELDLLIEQTRDESRLLRHSTAASSSAPASFAPSMDQSDEISELVMASRDAAYLEKKYGAGIANAQHSFVKNIHSGEDKCSVEDDSVSDGGRSYGSNISDESSLGDSD